jgi:hypothetical protein
LSEREENGMNADCVVYYICNDFYH